MAATLRVPFARVEPGPMRLGALPRPRIHFVALTPHPPAPRSTNCGATLPDHARALLFGSEGPGLTPGWSVADVASGSRSRRRRLAERGRGRRHRAVALSRLTAAARSSLNMRRALAVPVEYASQRKKRTRNKLHYRFNHWPIWIFVFFIAPGTADVRSVRARIRWRIVALARGGRLGTGIAGLRGRLPGVEPKPYIIRFTEDRPNPAISARLLYLRVERGRRVCAAQHGRSRGRHRDRTVVPQADLPRRYFPLRWPLARWERSDTAASGASTKGEGHERRYFYGTVWAVAWRTPTLWLLWKSSRRRGPRTSFKLVVFVGASASATSRVSAGCLARGPSCPATSPSDGSAMRP